MDVPNVDYAHLFTKFKEGDKHAFSFFYEFFINDLYAYGIALGGEKEIVKDTIHDIFLKIYLDKKTFDSVEHLKYFLLKSLKNMLYNVYSSKRVASTTCITEEQLNFSITTTVLDRMIDEEDRTFIQWQIDRLLRLLTARQKEAIYLRFIQELSYDEIADIMNMSSHAVRKLISRSLKRLKEQE